MKVTVDLDMCRGHGVCWSVCPEVFSLTDDGYAVVNEDNVTDEFADAIRNAASQCPERAITVA